jgi:hypothetical protein
MGSLESYFRVKPPCPAFGGVAPPNMKIEQVAGGTSNSIFGLNEMGQDPFNLSQKTPVLFTASPYQFSKIDLKTGVCAP